MAIPVSILRRMSQLLIRITWVNIYKRRKRQSEVRMRKKFRQLSLQAKMSSIFVLANLVVFAVTVILLLGINSMSSEIDKVYQGNLRLNEVSDALMAVQDSMTDYLNSKTSDSLEEFYRNEQTYSQLVQDMSDGVTGATFQRMERSIRHMSEEYLDLVSQTIEAKRGRNVEKYRVRYENATQMYEYINTYIYSLNNEQFRSNSENYSRLSGAFRSFEMMSVIALTIVIVLSVCMVVKLTLYIISPFKNLAVTADEVAGGNFDTDLLQVQSEDEIGVVTRAFNQMIVSIRQYLERLRQSMEIQRSLMEKELLMEAHLKDAQLKYLQAQINPHFLYNTLNTISYYVRSDPDNARKLISYLSDYFRHSLNNPSKFIPLSEELHVIECYTELERARFGDRLSITYDFPKDKLEEIQVPPLLLQPLVENAVVHGIFKRPEGGRIKTGLIEHKDYFKVYVYDTGIGIPKSKLKKLLIDHKRRDHIGLINVHQRLLSLFGEKSGLHIVSRENKGTLVFTNIPKIESRRPAAPDAIEKVAATGQTIRITNA